MLGHASLVSTQSAFIYWLLVKDNQQLCYNNKIFCSNICPGQTVTRDVGYIITAHCIKGMAPILGSLDTGEKLRDFWLCRELNLCQPINQYKYIMPLTTQIPDFHIFLERIQLHFFVVDILLFKRPKIGQAQVRNSAGHKKGLIPRHPSLSPRLGPCPLSMKMLWCDENLQWPYDQGK